MADSQQSRLNESQDSLATALARLEAHRTRERILFRENQALRKALLQNGVSPAELKELIRSPASAAKEGDETHDWQDSAYPGAAGEVHCPSQQVDEHTVHYLISDAKGQLIRTVGRVLISDESLEFVQRVARITPTEFLGIRALPALPAATELSGSATWGERTRQGASAGAGVLSDTAAWLLQRVRRSASGSGGVQAGSELDIAKSASSVEDISTSEYAHGLPSISSIVRTILSPKEEVEEDESTSSGEDEALAAESDAAPDWGPACEVEPEPGSVVWEVLWKNGGGEGQLQRLKFEGQISAQESLQQHMKRATETWSLFPTSAEDQQEAPPGLQTENVSSLLPKDAALRQNSISGTGNGSSRDDSPHLGGVAGLNLGLAEPRHLVAASFLPHLSEASSILTNTQVRALASALPARHQLSHWILHYSSARHGISLQTMYRRTLPGPSVLVVRDSGGYIFGCYTPLPWKPSPRYYGTGETFVFQLQPHMVAWGWKRSKDLRNDFFMYSTAQSLGVGGGGHFALFLDGDLLHGTSGCSQTFGNPCLASNDDFTVGKVELWGLA